MIGKRSSCFHCVCVKCLCMRVQGSPPEMRMGVSLTPAPPEDHPVDQLLELLSNAVQFAYTCWDRIVLNGYIERLQRPENLIYFFHDVVGIDAIEPAVLEQRTNA